MAVYFGGWGVGAMGLSRVLVLAFHLYVGMPTKLLKISLV